MEDHKDITEGIDNKAILKFVELMQTLNEIPEEEQLEFNAALALTVKQKVEEEEAERAQYYTAEEKRELAKVFLVFSGYIKDSEIFEFSYSEKRGYFYYYSIEKEYDDSKYIEGATKVESAEDLFRYLVKSLICDVVIENLGDRKDFTLSSQDRENAKTRVIPYLERFDEKDKPHYESVFEEILSNWNTDNTVQN